MLLSQFASAGDGMCKHFRELKWQLVLCCELARKPKRMLRRDRDEDRGGDRARGAQAGERQGGEEVGGERCPLEMLRLHLGRERRQQTLRLVASFLETKRQLHLF
jgi:hypothetical protein